jgi:hypothetical protein
MYSLARNTANAQNVELEISEVRAMDCLAFISVLCKYYSLRYMRATFAPCCSMSLMSGYICTCGCEPVYQVTMSVPIITLEGNLCS